MLDNNLFSNILVFLCIIFSIKLFSKFNVTSLRHIKYSPHKKAYNNFKSISNVQGKSLSYISERMNILPTKVEIFDNYKLCSWHLSDKVLVLRFSLDDICIKVEDEIEGVVFS